MPRSARWCSWCESLCSSDYRSAADSELYENVMLRRGSDAGLVEVDIDGDGVPDITEPEFRCADSDQPHPLSQGTVGRRLAADNCFENHNYSEAQFLLRQDLGSLKALWHDDWKRDLWLFQRQERPF